MTEYLGILVVAALNKGEYERAIRLSGASHALWTALGVPRSPSQYTTATHGEVISTLRRHLPNDVYSSIWRQSREMNLDSVVELVLDNTAT